MLKIFYGRHPEEVDGDLYFKHQFDYELLNTEFSKKVILDIDKTRVIGANLAISDVLGPIAPERFSCGSKCILLVKYFDVVVNFKSFGENCYRYFFEIAKERDILMASSFYISLYHRGYTGKIYVENTGVIVDNDSDLIDEYDKCMGAEYEG